MCELPSLPSDYIETGEEHDKRFRTSQELEPGPVGATRTKIMMTRMGIYLLGCLRSLTRRRLRRVLREESMKIKEGATEEECVAGQVVTRAKAKKSHKVHPLKVKEAMFSVDKSTMENLQKKDSTLKKCFNRMGNPIIRENDIGEFYQKNGLLYQKHQETKTGRSFNQLVVPKELDIVRPD